MKLSIVICTLGIIVCILILLKSIKNYRTLNSKYMELQTSHCVSNCQDGLFKTEKFFYMKNDGANPCEPITTIQYVDYIGTCNLFIETVV